MHFIAKSLSHAAAWLLMVAALWCIAPLALGRVAEPAHTERPVAAALQSLPAMQWAGQGRMRFWGLLIYDARLWVGKGFDAQAFTQSPLVLELTYHRAFNARDIAKRSVQEIQRQRPLSPQQAQRWSEQLAQWLPDVQAGDSLTGVYMPGKGMRLWHGEQALGHLQDTELAQHFFGIWLSAQTSAPELRSALLAGLRPSQP